MSDLVHFSTHHAGANYFQITFFSALLLVIAIIFSSLFMYRLVRDTRKLRALHGKEVDVRERLKLKDQVFGWIIALSMLYFVWAASISKLV